MKIEVEKISASYWQIHLNNPPLNLFDPEMTSELSALITTMETSKELKVVVFKSAVKDYFIAHLDLARLPEFDLTPGPTGLSPWPDLARRLETATFISIAMVQGRARGVGSEFIQAMDMCFASKEKSLFSQIEVACGLIPGGGGMERLPLRMSRARVMEVIIGADDFDADTAAAYGWINRSIADDKLEAFVDNLAKRIASFDKESIHVAKSFINKRLGLASIDNFKETQNWFFQAASSPMVQDRIKALFAAGINQEGKFELDLGRQIANF